MSTRPAMLFGFLFLFAVSSSVFAAPGGAQQQVAPAPVPAQILSAKTIFIANGGGASDPNIGSYGEFTGGPERAYNEFYAAVKTFPNYTLVGAPAGADLVLEISFSEFPAPTDSGKGTITAADAKFRLVIIDPKTHVTLWTITEYVGGALLAGNREKNYQQGMERLVADLRSLTSSAPLAAPANN
jgi:hypothetical protein